MLNNSFHDDDKQQAGLALDREPNAVATLCLAKATAEPPPPVVGQQQERLREPGGRCLTAGNGYTWSGRPDVGPSWNSKGIIYRSHNRFRETPTL